MIWPGPDPAPEPVRGLRGFGLRVAAMLLDLALLAGLEFLALTVAAFVWLLACAPAGAVPTGRRRVGGPGASATRWTRCS